MTIGRTGNSSSNSRRDYAKERRRKDSRRILLETLEGRQLMAVGPQLVSIQPNEGALISEGQVLNVSPAEIIVRFDDSSAIDPATVGPGRGILVSRSGGDGTFDRAYVSSDLGTNGAVVLDFASAVPGQVGNGLQVSFTKAARTNTSVPVLTLTSTGINIEVNTTPGLKTTAQDILNAFNANASASAKFITTRLRGSGSTVVADSVPVSQPLVLTGANTATATSNLNAGNNVQVEFLAAQAGPAGLRARLIVTQRDFGGAGLPVVSVSSDANFDNVTVQMNSNSRFATTLSEFVNAINNSAAAANIIRARTISGAQATAIGALSTSYSPITLRGIDDIYIQPGYVGVGETGREVVIRFAEPLPDDSYRIDILGTGSLALKNVRGENFNNGQDRSLGFELDLGARVEAIVPQPITRSANGTLTQARNEIHVYFNEDVLNTANANDPQFYQLRYTRETVDANDDVVILPTRVAYNATTHRAVLTFARNLDQVVDGNGNALPISTMRLRIGSKEQTYAAPTVIDVTNAVDDPGSRFNTARDLTTSWDLTGSGPRSVIVNSTITNPTPYNLDFPGANDEPGQRENLYQVHNLRTDVNGLDVFEYNFQRDLGFVNNSAVTNAITETQKQLARQIFSLYENYLGVRFIETNSRGMTIAIGDMRAIDPIALNGPGGLALTVGQLVSNGQFAAILDLQDFGNSSENEFGSELFRNLARGIGALLGRDDSSEVPSLTVQSDFAPVNPGIDVEMVFPGNADITYGQHILRPEVKDIDLYRVSIPKNGKLSIEVGAERSTTQSLLDSALRLYRQNSQGGWDEVARNDDYFSQDSLIRLDVTAGEYIVGVSAKGNESYDPSIEDSGLGGRSNGRYSLRMDFRPPQDALLRDATGTIFDGDSDGRPGGVYDFWFVPSGPSNTIYVDKAAPGTGNGSGTLASPYRTIAAALSAANATPMTNRVIRIVGNGGSDGLFETQADNLAYEIGFNRLGQAQVDGDSFNVPKNATVMIDAGAIVKVSRARIGVGSTTVSAGADRSGGALQTLGIPRMIDSRGAVIADLEGDPIRNSVYFTSLNDQTLGRGSNRDTTPPAPRAGDWGGIDIRNRIDASVAGRRNLETNGMFLNSIIHSDIRYGGGQVLVDGVSQVITPIHMVDSRPTIANSRIQFSADAAMAATPNSFLESNFHDPITQGTTPFISDLQRVGPEIHGNRLSGNSINGLFVKTRTDATTTTEVLSLPGRFDDLDIVHVISENLIIQGTTGGAIAAVDTPASTTVILTASNFTDSTQGLFPGSYHYRFAVVDVNGNEGPYSESTNAVTVNSSSGFFFANGFVRLGNLPSIQLGEQLRIYRASAFDDGSAASFGLVATLNSSTSVHVDSATFTTTPLQERVVPYKNRLNGSLTIDPGTVVKLRGSRIEVQNGAQLLAEGTESRPIVMTSINDTRYGAGGTFDTANRVRSIGGELENQSPPAEGNWGGIYVGQTSTGSLDYVRLFYAGGTTRIDGGFASFNPIEAHQARLRVAHSRLELNASGVEDAAPTNRAGRGTNFTSTIFVRGSQPIIVDNIIQDNLGAAINIDVDSLDGVYRDDYGRASGLIDKAGSHLDNQGPLVERNRLDDNSINGMIVRGQTLTSESVWDDSDIVHVLFDEVISSNLYTYGGVKLVSKNSQSLVVKMEGATAGFTATGVPLDINDRIGGNVTIVGAPSAPVVLTSLNDCSVGAGFTPSGEAQFDTENSCSSGTLTVADVIVLMDESGSMLFAQQFSTQLITDLEAGFLAAGVGTQGGNRYGLVGFGDPNEVPRTIPVGPNGNLFGTATEYVTAAANLTDLGVTEDGWTAIDFTLDNYTYRPEAAKYIILVTNEDRDEIQTQTYTDLVTRLSSQGIILNGIYDANIRDSANASPFLALDSLTNVYKADGNGSFTTEVGGGIASTFGTTQTDYIDMTFATGGLVGDINQISQGGLITQSFSRALVDVFVDQAIGSIGQPGDWRGLQLLSNSNDRNVTTINELESAGSFGGQTVNNLASQAQYLGTLASNPSSGDESASLGFQISGVLNRNSDVDVYSFDARGGTEVWLDIDRTANSLDTVVELIDTNGNILVLSDDSGAEEDSPALLYRNPVQSGLSANPLRKSALSVFPSDSFGAPRDEYTTNPKDAGFRVSLPGSSNQSSLYHIRVRSSNAVGLTDANRLARLTDPALVGEGQSKGAYQLQVRLSERQEFPGSGIAYADIRFANVGIDIVGLPRHSPLVGDFAEQEVRANFTDNDVVTNAQELGNILRTDRASISLAGNLSSSTDVDWYTFTIDYELLETPLNEYLSTIFDIDYADGIGRPDTSMYLFRDVATAGQPSDIRLINSGLNSGILDDRAFPLRGADLTELERGSAGNKDAFIGPALLPLGRYYLAVTSQANIPRDLLAASNSGQGDARVRIQPSSGARLIVEDHVSSTGLFGDGVGGSSAVPPVLNGNFITDTSVVQYQLGDVPLYVSVDAGVERTQLFILNASTGDVNNNVTFSNGQSFSITEDLRDIAFRFNGDLRGFNTLERQTALTGDLDGVVEYFHIDDGTATTTNLGGLTMNTVELDATGEIQDANVGFVIEALTFFERNNAEIGYFVASRAPSLGVPSGQNVIYRFNPNTGDPVDSIRPPNFNTVNANGPDTILGAGTSINEVGFIDTDGITTGATAIVAADATRVHAISGTTYSIDDGDTFTLQLSPIFSTTFEFNSGPQVNINLDPINGASNGRLLADGNTFTLDGITYEIDTSGSLPANTPTRRFVAYSTSMSNADFANSLRSTMSQFGINVGQKGTRFNFSGTTSGDFSSLPFLVASPALGDGNLTIPTNTEIQFLANDTQETIAYRIAQAINQAGFPGLSAVVSGRDVTILGAQVLNTTGAIQPGGQAPGGTVTGIAFVNGDMYAVSDAGGLYRVSAANLVSGSPLAISEYITTSTDLIGIPFSGLVAGPDNADGGKYANMLFATDANGLIHAFDLQGRPQGVFAGGLSSIDTGIFGLTGLAFSNLDYNLWHRTGRRGNNNGFPAGENDGHGLVASPDGSIRSEQSLTGTAGQSWWFGFQNRNSHPGVTYTPATDPSTVARQSGDAVTNTYNFAGGALGVLESQSFSLSNVGAADQPFLYFNYFLSTEDRNSIDPSFNGLDMLDSFRVMGAGDDGVWRVLTTNNSDRDPGPIVIPATDTIRTRDEFDPVRANYARTQETFENTTASTAWRQARVDLSPFAGSGDVRIRFEFSTAGGLGLGREGGQAPELKVVAGDRLRDGVKFVVNDQTFEIEMGPTLIAPSGSAIQNGDFITVPVQGNTQSVRFQFFNGVGTAPTETQFLRVVPFTASQSASEIATNLLNAISGWITPTNFPNPVVNTGVLPENGLFTIAGATNIGVNRQSVQIVGSGTISQTPAVPGSLSDVDLMQVNLETGSTIAISVERAAGSNLSPAIRLFDQSGRPVTLTLTTIGNAAALGTTITEGGVYYIGISTSDNANYSPIVDGTSTDPTTNDADDFGNYNFIVDVTNNFTLTGFGNRIQFGGGTVPSLPVGSKFVIDGANGSTGVPVRILGNMTAAEVATAVANALSQGLTGGTGQPASQRGDILYVPGLTFNDVGPFRLTNQINAHDDFSEYRRPGFIRPATRAQNNAFEGVYLDDFFVGVTEVGETYTVPAASDTVFVPNPRPVLNAINVGPYQLEIRGASDFAFPNTIGTIPPINPAFSFDVNQRLTSGQTWKFTDANNIADGDTVTITDGTRQVVIEFNDTAFGNGVTAGNIPFNFSSRGTDPRTGAFVSDSAEVIASRFRDLLNSTTIQNRLSIWAVSINGATTGIAGDEIAVSTDANIIFNSVATNPPITIIANRLEGHENTRREQGQVIVRNSKISDSTDFGIRVRPEARNATTDAAAPGSVRNTAVLNTERLVTGAAIINNELIGNRSGGIDIVGDISTTTNVVATVPFVRAVNNTIVGGSIANPPNTGSLVIGNQLFDQGAISFADSVVSYNNLLSGGPAPTTGLDVPADALLVPNYSGGTLEPTGAGQGVVSLGRGGQLIVSFTDNYLTGSGDTRPDLVVYEVGESERVRVEVSADGNRYFAVGFIDGVTQTVDLDAFGFNRESRLRFVRLTDEVNDGSTTGASVGADIDAVGAISAVTIPIYTPGGTGIRVGVNASPTLLNNILVNNTTALDVDTTSSSTVIGGTLFQRNTQPVANAARTGQFPTIVADSDELFLDPVNRQFYPKARAKSIDASIDSLVDRAILLSVKQSLGLDASPILVPNYDLNGLLRVDDPEVTPQDGSGQNVFKDRGAQERSDFLGPTAALVEPLDNDAAGKDLDPSIGFVELNNFTARYFDIRLFDGAELDTSIQGIGLDPNTVTSAALIVSEDNLTLVEGVDYQFGYDPSTGVIRLTPLGGVWKSDVTYRIRFLNTTERAIELGDVSSITDGTTYTVIDELGNFHAFELDTGYRVTVPTIGTSPTHGLVDAQQFSLSDGFTTVTFEFDLNSTSSPGVVPISISPTETATSVAAKTRAAIAAAGLNVSVNALTGTSFQLMSDNIVLTDASNLIVIGAPGARSNATRVVLNASTASSASAVASALAAAIQSAAISGIQVTTIGGTVLIGGSRDVVGEGASIIRGIADRAGNALRSNTANGETVLNISLGNGLDYGDAPDPSYDSLKNSNGPRHLVFSDFKLGNSISIDADARNNNGDNDDGVTFNTDIVQGFTSQLTVLANGITAARPGYLTAWIDFDGDSQFEDSEVITNLALGNDILVNGNNTLNFTVPSTAKAGTTYARFRFGSERNYSSLGEAADGEVEDYAVTIVGNPYQNPTNRFDVNNDGSVSPIDVLQVINFLSRSGSSNVQLVYPANRPVPPYVDVNGDGRVAPIDILNVINEIDRRARGQGEGEGEGEGATSWIPASAVPAPAMSNSPASISQVAPPVENRPTSLASNMPTSSVPTTSPADSLWVEVASDGDQLSSDWVEDEDLVAMGPILSSSSVSQESVYDDILAEIDFDDLS